MKIVEKNKYDNTDRYHILMNDRLLKLFPVIGASAALVFTIARIAGKFAYVNIYSLIGFDIACASYFLAAFFLKKYGIIRNGQVSEEAMFIADMVVDGIVIIQWNLITYIFPTRTFWGYAPMFVLLTAFMFHTKAVLYGIVGISGSIAISWFILGDKLLPYQDELFVENLSLRIVALIISFTVIYTLTYYAERFTNLVKESFKDIQKQNEELAAMSKDIIDFTADIIEERDITSGFHVKRLKTYTKILAKQIAQDYPEYELSDDKIEQITLACVLHDVGKIGIPDNILLKPAKLTPEEFEIIKTHTTLGGKLIDKLPDSVGDDYKRYCKEICQFHHEKYDGNGYPIGLKGDDIPISAQIVSVVDCFDALCNERPYKPAFPKEVAINMILDGQCGAFSDKMKSCIVKCKEQLIKSL